MDSMKENGPRQNETSTESKCPICNGTGWESYVGDNGYEYVRECSCGLNKREIMAKKLNFANIPDAFKEMRLANFSKDVYRNPESTKIIDVDCRAVNWWITQLEKMKTEGMGLYLYSNCKGSGKTRMATSIANELIYEHGMNVKFATSIQIINEIKASWNNEEGMTEHQLLDDLAKAEVLVIDDFGIETVTVHSFSSTSRFMRVKTISYPPAPYCRERLTRLIVAEDAPVSSKISLYIIPSSRQEAT